MTLTLRLFTKCMVLSVLGTSASIAMDVKPQKKTMTEDKALHDYWALQQATENKFQNGFPKELRDRIGETRKEVDALERERAGTFTCPNVEMLSQSSTVKSDNPNFYFEVTGAESPPIKFKGVTLGGVVSCEYLTRWGQQEMVIAHAIPATGQKRDLNKGNCHIDQKFRDPKWEQYLELDSLQAYSADDPKDLKIVCEID